MISRLTTAATLFAVLATASIAWAATPPGRAAAAAVVSATLAGTPAKTLPRVVVMVERRAAPR